MYAWFLFVYISVSVNVPVPSALKVPQTRRWNTAESLYVFCGGGAVFVFSRNKVGIANETSVLESSVFVDNHLLVEVPCTLEMFAGGGGLYGMFSGLGYFFDSVNVLFKE